MRQPAQQQRVPTLEERVSEIEAVLAVLLSEAAPPSSKESAALNHRLFRERLKKRRQA